MSSTTQKINNEILNCECPVCLEEITADMPLIRFNCSHQLCLTCYNQYLITKFNESYGEEYEFKKRLSCPLCRKTIIEKTIEEMKREYARELRFKEDNEVIELYLNYIIRNGNIEDYKKEIIRESYKYRYDRFYRRLSQAYQLLDLNTLRRLKDEVRSNLNDDRLDLWRGVDGELDNKVLSLIVVLIHEKEDQLERDVNNVINNNNNNNQFGRVIRPRIRARGRGRNTSRDHIITALEELNNATRERNNDENGFWAYSPISIMNKIDELNLGAYSIETIKQKLRELFREQRIGRQREGRSYKYSLRSGHYDN